MLPALDLAGVVRITRLINHSDGHLPSRQGVSPIMQPYYGAELVAELPRNSKNLAPAGYFGRPGGAVTFVQHGSFIFLCLEIA